ncbi:chromate ion transporter-like protein [Amniculicola lignicola CBS 123094]|uniref:Chromate ion transporter-like protein n=1 Tax=Amniculicola lignicola CBS 123094 TaxID=1392246 RepID=A0A6A5WRL9_9PLEO|nr:chromate ion transporter-like protein [Amniculicola lignicola CBS 123094]
MPLLDIYRAVRAQTKDPQNSLKANDKSLAWRLSDVFARTWDLGFTSFGGPAVHFQILHRRFVEGVGGKTKWIDEQTFQELFAICQALPGPGSTKMAFCIALVHAGFLPALFVFLLWSLPGAIGMYALSLGISNVPEKLSPIAYALLSGLNASTVGIVALAAVQLATKAIIDKLTRVLVIFGACAGLCYSALWYFPVLVVIGGIVTMLWDVYFCQVFGKLQAKWRRKKENPDRAAEESNAGESIALEETPSQQPAEGLQRRSQASTAKARLSHEEAHSGRRSPDEEPSQSTAEATQPNAVADTTTHGIPIKLGIAIIVGFFVSFTVIMVLRGTLPGRALIFDVFANMYLAGTIIFGGGPVVIPLLRSYVVDPGWVSPRDFLIGLAIIQAFPGPNFNFGVFLGALAVAPTKVPTVVGALLGFLGMFVPGITLAVGFQSLWAVLRTKPWLVSLLRGINATAVGLVFTAVYRLWEIGYLTPESGSGKSLADDPWWVVVAALSYASTAWFSVPPAIAIIIGGILGLCWYGAVGR